MYEILFVCQKLQNTAKPWCYMKQIYSETEFVSNKFIILDNISDDVYYIVHGYQTVQTFYS
jgi:hypothetical protein